MTEQWRNVIGYEGGYQVSSAGRVRSLPRTVSRSDGIKQPVEGRILKDVASSTGYRTIVPSKDGIKRTKLVHRLVLTAFRGNCPIDHEGAHLNGKRSDNRLKNLIWATLKENASHRFAHGTQVYGERAGSSKLTDEQVIEIRQRKLSRKKMAEKYGVATSTIRRVLNGKHWSHLSGDTNGK